MTLHNNFIIHRGDGPGLTMSKHEHVLITGCSFMLIPASPWERLRLICRFARWICAAEPTDRDAVAIKIED